MAKSQHTLVFMVPANFSEARPLVEGNLFIPVTSRDNQPETLYLRTQP